MLKYNLKRIFKLRGIERPFSFLVKAGFSNQLATHMSRGRLGAIRLSTLEKLCLSLNCTPNDLLEWHPSADQNIEGKYALYDLKANAEVIADMTMLIHGIPADKLDKVVAYIKGQSETTSDQEVS